MINLIKGIKDKLKNHKGVIVDGKPFTEKSLAEMFGINKKDYKRQKYERNKSIIKMSFSELTGHENKSLDIIKPSIYNSIKINGVIVDNYSTNKVECTMDIFAHIQFYDKVGNRIAHVELINCEKEYLIIDGDNIYSESSLRIMNKLQKDNWKCV